MQLSKILPLTTALAAQLLAQAPAAPAPAAAPAPPPPPAILGFAVTGTTTIGSQYIFRGLSQTDGQPTIQGELDLVHPSGFYLSTALSNVSWFTDQNLNTAKAPVLTGSVASASLELDLFGGYKWGFAKDWTLDVGFYRYLYPGTYTHYAYYGPNTTEGYLGLSYSWASLKYSRVLSNGEFGTPKADGSSYVDLSLAIPLGESGWTLQAHGGKTTYAGTGNSPLDYTDYKLGVSTEVKGYTFALAGTNADTKDAVYTNALGQNIGKGRVTFTITKAF